MRLIDADAFKEYLQKGTEENADIIPKRLVDTVLDIMEGIMLDIDEQPTIYAMPRWIPCDEKLPENESEVLVTDNNGHIRHAFYVAKWDWFGTYEESMTIRAIAWMPLPEPYDGERKDDE
jgi:hypothetical protein